jgi:hypothetical protein
MPRAFIIAALLLNTATARAQEQAPADNDTELATKLSNPVSKLVTLPFQFNYDCCYGPAAGDRVVLNVQPVMPFSISDHWNLILRTIVPIEQQGAMVQGAGNRFGLGDTTQTFFFTPDATPGDWIWGAGPAFLWPTATDVVIGSRKWGAGPSAIVLRQQSGWTYGLLFNHIWSYSGEREKPDISDTFLQPFLGYTWPDTTSLTFNSESNYDWKGERWAAPLNLTLGHLFRLGAQPVNLSAGVRYTTTARENEAQWGARLTITLLFPKT